LGPSSRRNVFFEETASWWNGLLHRPEGMHNIKVVIFGR
jgi:hypothetical protein